MTPSPWIDATLETKSEADILPATIARYQFSPLPVALCTSAEHAADATVLWVNAAFVRLSGMASRDVIGQSALCIAGVHPDAIHLAEVELLREHPEQNPFGIVTTKQRPDGRWYDVEEHILPLHGRRGGQRKVTHYLVAQVEIVRPQTHHGHRNVA